MIKLAVVCALLAATATYSMSEEVNEIEKRASSCICTANYQPVCAKKGGVWITYGNACSARCDRAKNAYSGECPSSGVSKTNMVVKRQHGNNDDDEYVAGVISVTQFTDGEGFDQGPDSSEPSDRDVEEREARGACACTADHNPVCGLKNGKKKTYSNECTAECESATSITQGPCYQGRPKLCACQAVNRPVCANGKQYANGCSARCAGVQTFTEGPC